MVENAVDGSSIAGYVMMAFAACNALRLLAYAPQIACIVRDRTGAAAISLLTWWLFLASHLTTAVYAVVVLLDEMMALLFAGNALACGAIVALASIKRSRFFAMRSAPAHRELL